MDAIRTLLLARTHVVVMDADIVASAATRPSRDKDLDKLEDELAQLGFVMSLDLAMTVRRMPNEAIQELRNWIFDTLAKTMGTHRPHVPLFRSFPADVPANTYGLYLRRVMTWLLTRADQPCPWCSEIRSVGALDPCGHLVCRTCWDGGNYGGCPICHRRVTPGNPFVLPIEGVAREPVTGHDGQLRIIHLAFDLAATARARFVQLLTRATPLSPEDRSEVETVIDMLGPRAAAWLPPKIAVKESKAIALARLWMVSPDRTAILLATASHVTTATDVLRVATVLMGAEIGLVAVEGKPRRLGSIPRGLRRIVLEALDRIPPETLVEDVQRHRSLWQRAGEKLHPFEHAKRLPTAALAFAVVRGTDVTKATFGDTLRAQTTQIARLRIEDDRVRVTSWGGVIEDGLRAGDVRGIVDQLATRPGELLRRADHLVRVTQRTAPEALGKILDTIGGATRRGAPAMLLTLAAHVARRDRPWPRRVIFPKAAVLKAWTMPDHRDALRSDAIGSIVTSVRSELVRRAEGRSRFARAVIDRGLVDLLVPLSERSASKAKIAWPRGSEVPIPQGAEGAMSPSVRLFLHWEEPPGNRTDLDLSVALFDGNWRHVGTCDFTNLVVGDDAAIHSGDLTSAPPPLGASEFVDLHLERLHMLGARHAVMVIFSYNEIPFDKLPHGFAGLMVSPAAGTHFDPRAVAQRFDLAGRSVITVPLTIDLDARRLRWLDVHIANRAAMKSVGGYRAALAHIGKDFADLASTAARPTLWDVACIHAASRANLVYVRERDGAITQYRRRDGETTVGRLARLLADTDDDGKLAAIPSANAPTWFALLDDTLAIPTGSEGYILDARRTGPSITRLAASDLVAQLAAK